MRSSTSSLDEAETLERALREALASDAPSRALRELLAGLDGAEALRGLLEAHPELAALVRRGPSADELGRSLLTTLIGALAVDAPSDDPDLRLDRLVAAARAEDALDAVLGAPDLATARATARLREELEAELGLTRVVPITIGELDSDLLGRAGPDGVHLHEGFDPTTRHGRALLAHELAHEVQRDLGGMADLPAAEREAEAIMGGVLRGGEAHAPRVALPPGVYAGCGPQAMAEAEEREEEPDEDDTPTPVGRPEIPKPPVPPEPDTIEFPDMIVTGSIPKAPKPVEPTKPAPTKPAPTRPADAPAPECDGACPEPLPEHLQDAPVKAPPAEAPNGKGEERTLKLAGHTIRFRLPENAKAGQVRVRFRNADSPYGALTLKTALLTLDESLAIKGGQLTVDVRLGRFLQVPNATLTIGAKGHVAVAIRDARLQIGSIAKGKVDLDIGPGGVTGAGVFTAKDLALGPRLKVSDGLLAVRVSKGGAVRAHGLLGLEVQGLGRVELDACFVDGELRGKLTATLTKAIPFGLGRITRVMLSGCYRKSGWSLHGEVDLTVRDWVAATVKADLTRDQAGAFTWVVEGDVHQTRPITLGPVAVHDAHLHMKWNKTAWDKATGQVRYQLPHVMGELDGELDLERGKVSGTGDAEVVEPIPVGLGTLDEGTLLATLEDNELVSVTGSATLSVAHRGVPTFEVRCEQAVWDVKANELHAQGTMQVLRDVILGEPGALHAKIPHGHAGTFALEHGRLVHVDAGLGLEVLHGEALVGRGSLALDYAAGRDLEGALVFDLVGRWGLPTFATGPLFLLPGGRFSAALAKGALGPVEARGVQWELVHPQGTGRVCGQVDGSFDFAAGTGRLAGQAWVQEPWVVTTALGELVLGPEGRPAEGAVSIGPKGVERLGGTLGFALRVNAGPLAASGPLGLMGTLEGALDPETGKVEGGFEAQLDEASRLVLPATGDYRLVATGGTTVRGQLVGGELSGPLQASLAFDLERAAAPFLEGRLDEGVLDLVAGVVSGEAALGPAQALDLGALGVTLPADLAGRVLPGSELRCTLARNVPTAIGGELVAMLGQGGVDQAQAVLEVDWDLAKGRLDARGYGQLLADLPLTASAEAEGTRLSGWGLVLGGGSQVGVAIADNALASAEVQLEAWATRGEQRVARANIGGTWRFGDEDGLDGAATVTTVEDLRLVPEAGRFSVWLEAGSEVSATVLGSRFSEGAGQVVLGLDEGGRTCATLSLAGTLGEDLEGSAALAVIAPIRLAERQIGDTRFAVDLARGSGGAVIVEGSRPTLTEGELTLEVVGDEVSFARGEFAVQADLRQKQTEVRATGELAVFAPLPLGAAGDFELSLAPPTAATAELHDGLRSLEGALHLGLARRGGQPVGELAMTGRYEGGKTPLVEGEANVSIFEGIPLYEVGPYGLGLAPSSFSATLSKGQITRVDGHFGVHLEQRGAASEAPLGTLTVDLEGRYERAVGAKQGKIDGKGRVSVEGELDVADAGDYRLRLASGSEAELTLRANKITSLEGEVRGGLDLVAPRSGETARFLRIEAEASYRPAAEGKKSVIDARGRAVIVGRRLLHETEGVGLWLAGGGTEAEIVIEANEVKSLAGAIGAEIHDGRGKLFEARIQGSWSAASGKLDGVGEVRLAREVTLPEGADAGPRVVVEAGSRGQATVVGNKLSGMSGELSLRVHDERGPLVRVKGAGALTRSGELERAAGTATLLRPIDVAGDDGRPLLRITTLAGSAEVMKGRLAEVTGRLDFELPRLGKDFRGKLAGGWRQAKDAASKASTWGSGELALPILNDPAKGRKLDGKVAVAIAEDGAWSASGKLDYQLAPQIGGKVSVELDKKLDPVIGVDFAVKDVALAKGRGIFDRKLDLLPRMVVGVPPVTAGFGISAGLGLGMQDLVAATHIKAERWRPLSSKQAVPEFTAALALRWGLDLRAAVAAYLQVQLGVPSLAALNAGIEAELGLDMPVRLSPSGKLWGGPQGFGGEIGIGVTLKPKLGLDITPFISGELLFMDLGRHEFDPFRVDLGAPFELAWGTTYSFGDRPKAPEKRAASDQRATAAETRQVKRRHSAPPAFPQADKPAPTPAPGMPAIGHEAGLDPIGGLGGGESQGKLGAMMAAIDALGKLGEAAGRYMEIAQDPTTFMNPSEGGKRLADAWEKVAAEGRELYAACEGIFGSLKYSVPMWVRLIIEAPPGQTPSFIEAWAEEDDLSRRLVAAGVFGGLPLAGRVQLVEAMFRGSCGDEDEAAILQVLEHAHRHGEAKALVAALGVDELLSNIDGTEHDALLVFLRKAGIRHD